MKTIYFHIGYHRTGTTFIQSLLRSNRCTLEAMGCLYPLTALSGDSHSNLALALPSKRNRLVRQTRFKSGQKIRKEKYLGEAPARLYQRLAAEFSNSTAKRAIVSSECFLEFLDVKSLHQYLKRYSLHPNFIVFVRRQDRWIESVFSQVVNDPNLAFGGKFEELPQLKMLNFSAEIKHWIDCFSAESIHLRVYDEGMQSKHLASELSKILQLNVSWFSQNDALIPNRDTNASLDECCVEVLQRLNAWNQTTDSLRKLITKKSDELRRRKLFSNWRLPPEQAAEIVDNYKEDNRRLFDQLGVVPDPTWGRISTDSYTSEGQKAEKYDEILDLVRLALPDKYHRQLHREVLN